MPTRIIFGGFFQDLPLEMTLYAGATKAIPSEERRKSLELFNLENRQLKGNMTEVYKIIYGVVRVGKGNLPPGIN